MTYCVVKQKPSKLRVTFTDVNGPQIRRKRASKRVTREGSPETLRSLQLLDPLVKFLDLRVLVAHRRFLAAAEPAFLSVISV